MIEGGWTHHPYNVVKMDRWMEWCIKDGSFQINSLVNGQTASSYRILDPQRYILLLNLW